MQIYKNHPVECRKVNIEKNYESNKVLASSLKVDEDKINIKQNAF